MGKYLDKEGVDKLWNKTKGYVEDQLVASPDTNGYEYVDMGEAGIWATCNIGANNPEELGTKHIICHNNLEKYQSGELGNVSLEDDTAHLLMRGSWRLPTSDEFKKLIELCNIKGDMGKGVTFTLKTDNSKSVFFPETEAYPDEDYCVALYYSSTYDPDLNNFHALYVDYGKNSRLYYTYTEGGYIGFKVYIRAILDTSIKTTKYLPREEAEEIYAKKEDIVKCECEELTEEDIDDLFAPEEGLYCITNKTFYLYDTDSSHKPLINFPLNNVIVGFKKMSDNRIFLCLQGYYLPEGDEGFHPIGLYYCWDEENDRLGGKVIGSRLFSGYFDENAFLLTNEDIKKYFEILGYNMTNIEADDCLGQWYNIGKPYPNIQEVPIIFI